MEQNHTVEQPLLDDIATQIMTAMVKKTAKDDAQRRREKERLLQHGQ
jgi:hypothetical protein